MAAEAPVSIVIPVFNRSGLIVRCLDSVRAQTFRPLRIIVVDNNSSDGTPETVLKWIEQNKDPQLHVELFVEPSPGASAARNRGLAEVDSPYTLFFDSDDEMHPDLVADALNAIGDSDLVFWKADLIRLDGKVSRKPFHKDNLIMRQFFNSQLSTQQYMARTSLFRKIGGWNKDAKVWNDWELGIRIILRPLKYAALDKTLVTIHAQPASITGTSFHHRIGEWEHTLSIIEKDILESDNTDNAKKAMIKAICYNKMILASHYASEGYKEDSLHLLRQSEKPLTRTQRLLLRLLYRYTTHGGRAAYYLWNPFRK